MNNKNLFFFLQKIDSYLNLSKEIASLHITVPLNMLCLNCDDVNQELSARAARLADRMIQYVVDQNRDKNRGYEIRAAFQAGVSSTSCQFSGLCTGLLSRKICYFHAFFIVCGQKETNIFIKYHSCLSVLLHEAFLFFCDKIFTSGDHFVII